MRNRLRGDILMFKLLSFQQMPHSQTNKAYRGERRDNEHQGGGGTPTHSIPMSAHCHALMLKAITSTWHPYSAMHTHTLRLTGTSADAHKHTHRCTYTHSTFTTSESCHPFRAQRKVSEPIGTRLEAEGPEDQRGVVLRERILEYLPQEKGWGKGRLDMMGEVKGGIALSPQFPNDLRGHFGWKSRGFFASQQPGESGGIGVLRKANTFQGKSLTASKKKCNLVRSPRDTCYCNAELGPDG